MSKVCCKCKINAPGLSSKYCNPCHASNMRVRRITHILTPHQRKTMNARSYAHVYLKRGKILKEPCRICNNPQSQMHHPDYNQPLLIEWYCRKHHLELHKKQKADQEKSIS